MGTVRNEKGYAMLLLMVVIAFTVLLGTAAFSLSAENKKAGILEQQQLQCYYIAESGLEHALARATAELNGNNDQLYSMSVGDSKAYLNGKFYNGQNKEIGHYNVLVEKVGIRQYKFKSTGTMGNITKYLETIIQVNNEMDFSKGAWIGGDYKYDISKFWDDLFVTFNSDLTVKGNITALRLTVNGNLNIDGNGADEEYKAELYGVKVTGNTTLAKGNMLIERSPILQYPSYLGNVFAPGRVEVYGCNTGDIYSGDFVKVTQHNWLFGSYPSNTGNITSKNGVNISGGSVVKGISTEGNVSVLASSAGNIITHNTADIKGSVVGEVKGKGSIITDSSTTNSLFSAGNISLKNGSVVNGNVWAQNIDLNKTTVKGHLYAINNINVGNNVSFLGLHRNYTGYTYSDNFNYIERYPNVSSKFPDFIKNFDWYYARTPDDHKIHLGRNDRTLIIGDGKNVDYYLPDMRGVYVIDSVDNTPFTVYVKGRYSGNVIIVAKGNIIVNGNLTGGENDSLALIANGNLTLGDYSNVYIRALLYSSQTMTIRWGSEVHGALITKDLDVQAALTFYYDDKLVNLPYFASRTKPPFTVIRKEKFPVVTPF